MFNIPFRTPDDRSDNIEAVGRSRCIPSSMEIDEDNVYFIKIIGPSILRVMELTDYLRNLIDSIASFAENWKGASAEEPPPKVSKVKSSLLR